MKLLVILNLLLPIFCCNNCLNAHVNNSDLKEVVLKETVQLDSISYTEIGNIYKQQLLITRDYDLNRKVCVLPKGIELCAKGGIIRNGIIVGNSTKIRAGRPVFDKVAIRGTWNVPKISTAMFVNLDYENSLRDVVALASPDIYNDITIEKGVYHVSARKKGDVCISLCGNTAFKLQGSVILSPNSYKHYNIIQAQGENIKIYGNGYIIGDKPSHTGTDGEWGMGVRFNKAHDSSVSGLTIKDCWGDCIYIGGNSKNILIEKCSLDNGRRQGISITKANGVTIQRCKITNVSGTNPQYAIDIEPNRGDTVSNVLIDNVVTHSCEGGFAVVRSSALKDGKPVSWIGNVKIRNCRVSAKSKYPLLLTRCESLAVEKCVVYSTNAHPAIEVNEVEHVRISDNTIVLENNILYSVKNIMKQAVGRKDVKPISVLKSKNQEIRNNKIIEY